MQLSKTIEKIFEEQVSTKYQIYNSFFMSLPYAGIENVAMLLPILNQLSTQGLESEKSPKDIVNDFLKNYVHLEDERKQLDFLFRVVQYIERQVVLFDSIEDTAFKMLHKNLTVGTLANTYNFSRQQKLRNTIKKRVKNTKVRIVFTAHPTQFYPNDVLRLIADLQTAIKNSDMTAINMLLRQLGKTPFIKNQKPTPLEEARSIMYYLRYIQYNAIKKLNTQIVEYFYDDVEDFKPVLELGFWPGGDRDGNPFVNATITDQVTKELKYDILSCYYKDLKQIACRLTFDGVKEKVVALKNQVYDNLYNNKTDLTVLSILNQLSDIRSVLIDQHNGLFIEIVDTFTRQVKTFGLHFASLDIRQDSSIHQQLLEVAMQRHKGKSYATATDEEKENFLFHSQILLGENDFEDAIHKDTINNIKQLLQIQKRNGEMAVHRYIISNSTSVWHILEILGLFKFCGYKEEEIRFDIVPLFETIEGLTEAQKIMDIAYKHPIYKNHLARRNKKQTIMLGFSDGTKDGGYVKANWEIYVNKEKLTAVSKANEIDVIFFDGRGGPPARGGGKTNQFYASQGQTIASTETHLTIQGQTISSQYGSLDQAIYNMEQLLTATALSGLDLNKNTVITNEGREIINKLASISHKKYTDLKQHPLFIAYLEKFSVLTHYGDTNIGSRPTKRAGQKLSLDSLRAIPFVGSWSQIKQNLPGYYGFGTAIEVFKQEGKLADLQQLFDDSLYFKTLVQNSMMALAKTLFSLTSHIKEDKEFADFWQILYNEYKLSIDNLLLVSNESTLMEREVINKLSIAHREKIVLPLLIIQQYALMRNKEEGQFQDVYKKLIVRSIFGNINASRNSA